MRELSPWEQKALEKDDVAMAKGLSQPPPGATALYAQGVQACSLLGLSLSCLRVYYKIDKPTHSYWPVLYWVWDGASWQFHLRTQEMSRHTHTRNKIYRLGIWAEFATLNDAKAAGLRCRETKLCPRGGLDPVVWGAALTRPKAREHRNGGLR